MRPSVFGVLVGILLIASGVLLSAPFLSLLGGVWYLGLGIWYLVCAPPYNDGSGV